MGCGQTRTRWLELGMTLTVLTTTRIPEGIKGALTKWFLHPHPNVHVGDTTARVRHEIWDILENEHRVFNDGYAIMVSHASNEQGFEIRTCGKHSYEVIDIEGFIAIKRHHRQAPA